MVVPAFPLRTKRLELRPFQLGDVDAVNEIERRPEVARYEYWEPRSREQTAAVLAEKVRQTGWEEGHWLSLAVVLPGGGPLVGDVALKWTSSQWRQGEVGYMLHPDHQGFGYATEAAGEMLRLGFEDFGLHRIVARADPRNTASVRVMERLGMRPEAFFRHSEFVKDEWCDECVYAILEDEFGKR